MLSILFFRFTNSVLLVLNSLPVEVPDFVKQTKDTAFIKHYVKSAREEKVSSFLSVIGKIASTAVKVVKAVVSEENGANDVAAKCIYSVSSGNSSSSTSSIENSQKAPKLGDRYFLSWNVRRGIYICCLDRSYMVTSFLDALIKYENVKL